MSRKSMSNDESLNLCTSFLSVSQFSFSASWRPEKAISDHTITGLTKSMILDILILVLEITVCTTTYSL